MQHKCEINLKLTIYMDCRNDDDIIRCYCLPETVAQTIADDLTDEKTAVLYEYEYSIKAGEEINR